MRVHSAVLSALALLSPLATIGCPSTYGCDPPSEQFNIDQPVTGADGANVPVPMNSIIASEPSVLEVALHNAVEGCVHESFAALMAGMRAKRAGEMQLRHVFARLSEDETRHGQLAWDLHDWLTEQLEPAETRMVEQRRQEALDQLPERARELQRRLPQALGYMGGEEAERLASRFAILLAA